MESKTRRLVIIGSVAFSIVLIVGAVIMKTSQNKTGIEGATKELRNVSRAELAAADGKNGATCFVAVDGMVYKIEDSPYWQNGEHTTSEGQAHCGLDLTEALKQSPHGKTKLEQLEKVGPLVN